MVPAKAVRRLDSKLPSALYGRGFAKLKTGDRAGGNADITAAKKIKRDLTGIRSLWAELGPAHLHKSIARVFSARWCHVGSWWVLGGFSHVPPGAGYAIENRRPPGCAT